MSLSLYACKISHSLRKRIAVTYCIIASLFGRKQSADEIMITYYFINYDLRQAISVIHAYVELLILKSKESKPDLDVSLPSFSESSLEQLNKKMSAVMPENEFSEQYKKSEEAFVESDIHIIFEMKRRCNEFQEHINAVQDLFTDVHEKVSLY